MPPTIALAVFLAFAAPPVAAPQAADEAAALLLGQMERALTRGAVAEFTALTTTDVPADDATAFTQRWFMPGVTRATIRERDRTPLEPGPGHRLIVDALIETGAEGTLATWRLDVVPAESGLRIAAVASISSVEGLFRLAIDESRQYRARNLVVTSEDLELRVADGDVFFARTPSGTTAAVMLGRGEMVFTPRPEAEQRQMMLLTGTPALQQSFNAAFVRFHPSEAAHRLPAAQLSEVPVDARDLARARDIFAEEVGKSFSVDLADLSRETWSLIPAVGDLLAEIRTRRYDTLTYARASSDPEDISLFDRARRRNLSIYSSRARLSARGPFYDEDANAEYDVLDYGVDTSLSPDRFWVQGTTRLRIKVRAYALSALTLRLAEPLTVQSVISSTHGRLLHIRVRNQNSLVINLPEPASRDDELMLTLTYAGRLEPQSPDRENLALGQIVSELAVMEPEPALLYSNRSYWHAQAPQSDYATATIRLTLPAAYAAVCSGQPAEGSPVTLSSGDAPARRLFVFAAPKPLRYLSCVVSRFSGVETREAAREQLSSDGDTGLAIPIYMTSTARQRSRAREVLDTAAEIIAFYTSIVGQAPYPSLSLAVVESNVPGGHAPGYMAVVNQPLPTSPFVWRDDPASFDRFPDFFIAHELAHQWWGQGVGWKNYHEQWLSEGLAQYFAAMFAERRRGADVFEDVVQQFARWALAESDQGPIYLGYRLGHVKGDSRIFRALVYNKGAVVLHMLRRLLGDEVFFNGIRTYYRQFEYRKAGSEDLRKALEAASGRRLERFFERWVYGQDTPRVALRWSTAQDDGTVKIALRQQDANERVFEFPVTLSLVYRDGRSHDETVIVDAQSMTFERPLTGELRRVEVNRDRMTPVKVER